MIGIICGGGDYPRLVAEACVRKRMDFCLLLLEGFCHPDGWPASEKMPVNFGEIGKAIDFFHRNKVEKIIFAGRVKRPKFNELLLDETGARWILSLGKAIFAGDDILLRAVSNLLAHEGFEIISGTDLLEDIFLSEGFFSRRKPSASQLLDVQIGVEAAMRLGANDLGQSVAVCYGEILGTEAASGTDFLIENCAQSRKTTSGGVLVKMSKPQQDHRLDLPVVGVETIEKLKENGFDGLAVESGRCIVVDRQALIDRADQLGMFLMGVRASKIKIFLVAGEASGDYLGGRLMEDILKTSGGRVEFYGVGGRCMENAGLKKLFSIKELSIIGIFEVLGKILHVWRLLNKTVEAILEYQPDVLVTIDSSGFTHRIDKRIKGRNHKIPVVHYVAPPVWAWRPWRAKSLHKFIDKLLVLLPFEEKLLGRYGLKTVFVGHPVVTDPDFERPNDQNIRNFLRLFCNIQDHDDCKIVTLLPGSRPSEIKRHLPLLGEFSRRMVREYGNARFLIPTVEDLIPLVENGVAEWEQKPVILPQKSQKILAYYSSHLAVAASGTVTLELARAGVPMVAIYQTSPFTSLMLRLLIRTQYVCLVNILTGRNAVPELLQSNCTADNIFQWATRLLNPDESMNQKKALTEAIEMLKAPHVSAADEILRFSSTNGNAVY
ncbi:MAG: lipid-A-disaccharide synthase [Holosporaceae bacterium]|jgi:lipid-A-disaccharide synthase|nr:lipid-A-disaccharide synthase [Holosporaceae bacterium]